MKRTISIAAMLLFAGCSTPFVPWRAGQRYVSAHPELDRTIASAVLGGEIVVGMDAQEVRAAGGSPVARFPYPKTSREAWLVPTAKLQLGHYRYHNTPLLRVMFERGRVISIQGID